MLPEHGFEPMTSSGESLRMTYSPLFDVALKWWPLISRGTLASSSQSQPPPNRAGIDPECVHSVRVSNHCLATRELVKEVEVVKAVAS